MSLNNLNKKGNIVNSTHNLLYPRYVKESKDENSHKVNDRNLNKPPINSREFGREITQTSSNTNLNGGLNFNDRRNLNASNKLLNYFRPVKKEETKKLLKNDTSLYNLRPRLTYSMNNSKNNSNNNSFTCSSNNENLNTINTDMIVDKLENKKKLTNDSGMDVEVVIDKENKNVSTRSSNNINNYTGVSNNMLLNASYNTHNLDFSFKSKYSITSINSDILIDPQCASDYLDEIYLHLKQTEFELLPKYGYMKQQPDLNEKMRAILIDWLVDVHLKFKLLPETLFLTVQLIDRFLEKKEISRNRLQLVGVTALFIACKYEEIYPPELKDFVYITDKAYSKNDILAMEYEILNELDFSITHPSPLRFLEIFVEISQMKIDEGILLFARYLLELFLIEYRMIKFPPSWIAAATLYITVRVKKLNTYNRKIDIPKLSGYSEEKLKECARDICIILDNADKSSLQAVKNKYSSSKFMEVAKWKKN